MTYAFLTHGRPAKLVQEIDLILVGPKGETPEEVARQNARAMASLGQIGQVKPKRSKKKGPVG